GRRQSGGSLDLCRGGSPRSRIPSPRRRGSAADAGGLAAFETPGASRLNRAAVLTGAPAETLLLILPADAGGDDHVSCTTPVASGMALAAIAAGFGHVVVHKLPGDGTLSGIRAQPLCTAEAGEPGVPRRLLLLPANVVPRPDWLRALRTTPVERDTLHVDGS